MNEKHYAITAHNFIASQMKFWRVLFFPWSLHSLFCYSSLGWPAASCRIRYFLLSSISRSIQSFTTQAKKLFKLPETASYEFKEINLFLGKMTARALEDYRLLKEFSETPSRIANATGYHPWQTGALMETNISENRHLPSLSFRMQFKNFPP